MRCLKCGTEFEGSFCPECGTKAEPDTYDNTERAYTKCRNCGTEYDGMYCPECGTKAKDPGFAQTVVTDERSQTGGKANTAAKPDRKLIALIIVIACAVLAAAAAAGLWAKKNGDTSDTAGTAAQSTQAVTGGTAEQSPRSESNAAVSAQPAQGTPAPTVYAQETAAPSEGAYGDGNVSWSGSSEEYLKDYRLDREQFTEADMLQLSQTELRMLLNGLYAYHGYTFTTDNYKRLFGRMPWYTPQEKTMEECESEFNTIERANKEAFIAREKAMGWR